MVERTFTKHEARIAYGQRFVEIMMKDKKEIRLNEKQAIMATKWKLLYEGFFRPFHYDYVYVITNGKGASKVGYTCQPKTRLGQLQTSSPDDLELVDIFIFRGNTGRNAERSIHRVLKSKDAHLSGEWFKSDVVSETVAEHISANYQTTLMDMEAAWEGSEALMPISRAIFKKGTRDRDEVEAGRKEFLWMAGIMRTPSGIDA